MGWVQSLFTDELLQLSLLDKGFNLFLQVVIVGRVMAVVAVESAILVSRPLIKVSLQLSWKGQGSFILNLYQDLVDRGSQQGETREFPRGGFWVLVLPSFSCPHHLWSPVLQYVFLSFSLFRPLFSGQ